MFSTSREGGSRFFLASVDTSRESGGEEVGSRSDMSGQVGSRFPFTPCFTCAWRVEVLVGGWRTARRQD